jgi:hypothetical protein
MSLYNKLENEGSPLSAANGGQITINPLVDRATAINFSLHYTRNLTTKWDGNPGYSVTGNEASLINSYYQEYNDGDFNPIPLSSELDMDDLGDPTYPIKYKNSSTYKVNMVQEEDTSNFL